MCLALATGCAEISVVYLCGDFFVLILAGSVAEMVGGRYGDRRGFTEWR